MAARAAAIAIPRVERRIISSYNRSVSEVIMSTRGPIR
jgi:hypothetical protein